MKQLLTVMNRLNKQTHQTLISCKYCNMFNIINDFQLLQKNWIQPTKWHTFQPRLKLPHLMLNLHMLSRVPKFITLLQDKVRTHFTKKVKHQPEILSTTGPTTLSLSTEWWKFT